MIIIVLVIDGLGAALCGLVIIVQARSATTIEMTAAMHVAELLVTDTIGLMKEAPAPLLLHTIALQAGVVRHVRATVTDIDGSIVSVKSNVENQKTAFEARAPRSFSTVIAPEITTKVLPVLLGNRLVGRVIVVSDPSDEIDEAWHYAHALLIAGLGLSLAILTALVLVFGRVLAPLSKLARGLRDLEAHNYSSRLPRPNLHEFAVLSDHFNQTASALEAAHKANGLLNRRLLTAQDDERRRTALELHDEVGPCLFALDVEANAILSEAQILSPSSRSVEHAKELVSIVAKTKAINRRLLKRLRPMGLGRVPLTENLYKVLVDLDATPSPLITHDIGPLADTYGPLVDLTIYRCAQEGLFNAVRHAKASRIDLTIREMRIRRGDEQIEMSIVDDGRGLQPSTAYGLGLTGMQERIEALDGRFDLATSTAGTALTIVLPLSAERLAADHEGTIR